MSEQSKLDSDEGRGLQTVAFSSGGFVMGVKSMNGVFYHSELNGWKSL